MPRLARLRRNFPAIPGGLLALGIVAGLFAGTAPPLRAGPEAGGSTETISVEEARAGLRLALAAGETAVAAELATALVRGLPKDFAARAALTEVLIRQSRAKEAMASARRAQALARGEAQIFEASLLRARASGISGGAIDGVIAGYWARRAIQEAPLDGYKVLARGEAQRLRTTAPLQLQFSFAAMPSSNVNNGSQEHEITLPGWGGITWALSPQSRALSGWIGEATLAGRYRLAEGATSARSLNFALHHRAVRLSSEAKAAISDWRASRAAAGQDVPEMPRYDYSVLELGLSERRALGAGIWSLSGGLGHARFGGRSLHDSLRLETGYEAAWRQRRVSLAMNFEKQWGAEGAASDAEILGLELGLQQQLGSGDLLKFGGLLRQAQSASLDQRHEAFGLRMGWAKSAPVAGLRLEASLGAEWRRYDPSLLSGRRDLRLDGGVTVGIERLEYMGFSPALHLNLGRVKSNVRLYEGTNTGISLRLRSVF